LRERFTTIHEAVTTPQGINSLITTAEAATICGVTVSAIRQWAFKGLITASGIDERGRKLYRLLDVAKAEHITREKARRH
jgi:DNA-binding transcriptional MerR regulator